MVCWKGQGQSEYPRNQKHFSWWQLYSPSNVERYHNGKHRPKTHRELQRCDVRHKTALLEEKYLRFQKYYKYKGLIVTLLI